MSATATSYYSLYFQRHAKSESKSHVRRKTNGLKHSFFLGFPAAKILVLLVLKKVLIVLIISKKKLYSVLNPKMYSSVIVNYLSTSPIFTAKLPNITTRSDIFHPIRRGLSTVRFINDGDLILHRYGAMPPSLTK